MLRCVEVDESKIKYFLNFPKYLYKNELCTQDRKLEESILLKTHILSSTFEVIPFIVLSNNITVARCILTYYPNSTTGFVGFFESVNSKEVVKCLFDSVIDKAKSIGLCELVGPINCAIWLGYRFKVDNFDSYYTGEPYNKFYYKDLWESVGFSVCENYYSDRLRIPVPADKDEKIIRVSEKLASRRNYTWVKMSNSNFDVCLKDIYGLLIDLYNFFPYFSDLSIEQFCSLYSGLKSVLNYNMVHLVYSEDKLVGYLIAIPNYAEHQYSKSPFKFMKLLSIKDNPKDYVTMYIGASPRHLGLGGILAEKARQYYEDNNCMSVNALIHRGNQSGKLYNKLTINEYNYVLLKLKL